jgi:hypothetical protein
MCADVFPFSGADRRTGRYARGRSAFELHKGRNQHARITRIIAMRHQTRRSNDFTHADPDMDLTAVKAGRPGPTPVVAPSVPAVHPALDPARVEDAIRTRAYRLWEAAGRPAGDGVTFWLEAERQLGVK